MAAYLLDDLINSLHRSGTVDQTNKITLRHLLSHASGLPDYLEIHTVIVIKKVTDQSLDKAFQDLIYLPLGFGRPFIRAQCLLKFLSEQHCSGTRASRWIFRRPWHHAIPLPALLDAIQITAGAVPFQFVPQILRVLHERGSW